MKDPTEGMTLVPVPCIHSIKELRKFAEQAIGTVNRESADSSVRIRVCNSFPEVRDTDAQFQVIATKPGLDVVLEVLKEANIDPSAGSIVRTLTTLNDPPDNDDDERQEEKKLPALRLAVDTNGHSVVYLEEELLSENAIGRSFVDPLILALEEISDPSRTNGVLPLSIASGQFAH